LKRFSFLLCTILSIILVSGCGNQEKILGSNSSADWAYNFVIWNDDIYEITEDKIEPNKIRIEIGEVKKYSDFEGIYGNGFSNKYPAGTKLYSVKDVETSDYIALQIEEGLFIKAIDKGKYGGKD